MNVRGTIQRVGFRKWYERELLQSHGHLVLLILCIFGLLGAVSCSVRAGWRRNSVLVCACASAIVGFWALRRYMYLFGRAQHVSEQAICPACHTYARWDIEDDAQELGARSGCGCAAALAATCGSSRSRLSPRLGLLLRVAAHPLTGGNASGPALRQAQDRPRPVPRWFLEWGLALHAVWVRRFVEADSRG